jgi:hypothetical protein
MPRPKIHHGAMVEAYQHFAYRFDPSELQQNFDRTPDTTKMWPNSID